MAEEPNLPRFIFRVFLLLDGLQTNANEVHLPGESGFKAPEARPTPLLLVRQRTSPPREGQELDLIVRGYLSRTPLGHFEGADSQACS